MKNNSIYSMEGVGKVYKFTLTQAFKNKGYRASFIIMILVIVFLGPIMRLGASSGQNIEKSINDVKEDKVNITELLIFNDSGVRIDEEDLGFADSGYKNISVSFPAEKDQKIDSVKASLTSTQVLLLLKTDVNESGMPEYKLQLISSDDTEIKPDILDSLGSFLIEKFDNARYEQAGVDKDIMTLVSSGFNEKKTYTDEEFTNASNRKYSDMEVVALGTTFAVIIMMVLSLASSYIVSSVMEEKVSKLVETLMISVRPLALVMGKIFAMMTYVLLILVISFAGSKLSNFVMDMIVGKNETKEMLNFDVLFKVGFMNAVFVIFAVILLFFIFAFFAGIAGGSCSKAEDMQSANGSITTLIMIGYIVAMFVPGIENEMVHTIISFVPIFSLFVVPVLYITESISLPVLLSSFAINIVIAIAMFFICAKVYRQLILIDGSKIKISTILKMVFGKSSSGKAKKEVA